MGIFIFLFMFPFIPAVKGSGRNWLSPHEALNMGFCFYLQLQESRCFKRRIKKLEDANKKLTLELEHEKGKLAGLAQSHSTLRDHTNILESALAKREADLVQLNLQVSFKL